tara:strand:- start:28 stop:600 length:573 start_codon:yes stop_codon:yes gene_type:complete
MYDQNYKLVTIAKELDIHTSTLRRWFRKEGLAPKHDAHGINPERERAPEVSTDPLQDKLDENLEAMTDDAVHLAKHDARLAEDKSMMELAEAQTSPADKYQSYISAAGIKLLRDSMQNLRGPKSVRELSELDQMIRRNLGLNARTGGGTGKVQIDISILNDAKADRGKGAVNINPKIIDAEPIEDGQTGD